MLDTLAEYHALDPNFTRELPAETTTCVFQELCQEDAIPEQILDGMGRPPSEWSFVKALADEIYSKSIPSQRVDCLAIQDVALADPPANQQPLEESAMSHKPYSLGCSSGEDCIGSPETCLYRLSGIFVGTYCEKCVQVLEDAEGEVVKIPIQLTPCDL